jgi:curved DNA-binding protein CbpA
MATFDWKRIDKNFDFRPEHHDNTYDYKFDFYIMLEIMPSVTEKEIMKASRKKSLTLHPDKGGKEEHFMAMRAFTEWFLEPGKRAVYDERRLACIRNRSRFVIFLSNSDQEVKETGKESFNRRKEEIAKIKCETKKRKAAAYSTCYQPAQSDPPGYVFFSPPSKKQRKMNTHNNRVFGLTASGKPCPNCMKGGDFCAQHQGQRSFPGFAGSGPVPSNPYSQQFPGRFPAGSTYTSNNYNTNVHTNLFGNVNNYA